MVSKTKVPPTAVAERTTTRHITKADKRGIDRCCFAGDHAQAAIEAPSRKGGKAAGVAGLDPCRPVL